MLRRADLLILILSAGSLAQVTQQKPPFTFEDMTALKRVNEPVVSPYGKWVEAAERAALAQKRERMGGPVDRIVEPLIH